MPNEKPCIYKHTCGFDICTMSECPDYVPKTKGKKWFEEEGDDNLVKPTEQLTEEQKKHIAEMLNEKHGNLSIESTIGFFEFIDMWKENLGILLKQVPEAEFVRVVRCKDCKHRKTAECSMYVECDCGSQHTWECDNDFCSYGERRCEE